MRGYQRELYQKLTPERVDAACVFVHDNPDLQGTFGSARLRRHLGDCSNLGEAAYLPLLQTVKGMFQRQAKLQEFFAQLTEHPTEALAWYVFGRAPYAEYLTYRQLQCSRKYLVDLGLGARRQLDQHLPSDQLLSAPLPTLEKDSLRQAITTYQAQVHESMQGEAPTLADVALSARQQTYLNKLERVTQYAEPVIALLQTGLERWNHPEANSPKSRWRWLKNLSRDIAQYLQGQGEPRTGTYGYFSIVRGILVTALLPHYGEGKIVTHLQVTGCLAVDRLVSRPFSQPKAPHQQKLPLQLLMGPRYVVGRPGNAAELTALIREEGAFALDFWPYRRRKQTVTGTVRLHDPLRDFFQRGAQLQTLTVTAGDAPAHKLYVTLTVTGPRHIFFTSSALSQLQTHVPPTLHHSRPPALGVDVNRLGDYMVAFSEAVELPADLLVVIASYQALERTLQELNRGLTRKRAHYERQPSQAAHVAWLKVQGEMERVYARRKRLLETIHQQTCQWVTTVLTTTESPVLCIEDLELCAKGTRGVLAKVILSLPDDQRLFERACLWAEHITGLPHSLVLVDPRGTSQGPHMGCSHTPPGQLRRQGASWDDAQCSACGQTVCTHHNAALVICARGLVLLSNPP